jgi:hypothetical protein
MRVLWIFFCEPSMRKYLYIWILSMALCSSVAAQSLTESDSIRTRLVVGLRAHYGFVLIHSYALDPVRHTFPWGTELDLGKQLVSKRAWDFCNCYPRVGAALTFWDYGSDILGYGGTAMGYVEPIYLTRHRLNLGFRLGAGISYQTHPYDSISNPNNQAYSLRVNVPVAVGLAMSLRINPHWSLRLAGNFNHVSNGGLALPNKGINYPTMSLGADYAPQGIDFKERAKNMDKSPPDPRLRFYAGVTGTLKRAGAADTRQNGVWGIWTQGVYYLGRWSGLNLGLEWINDGARKLKMQRENIPGRHERGGILVGHQFLLGRVVFSQQLGVYFFDQFKLNDPVYQRYGLGLHVTHRLFAGFNLKTHRHVADLLELRLAWGIWRK